MDILCIALLDYTSELSCLKYYLFEGAQHY